MDAVSGTHKAIDRTAPDPAHHPVVMNHDYVRHGTAGIANGAGADGVQQPPTADLTCRRPDHPVSVRPVPAARAPTRVDPWCYQADGGAPSVVTAARLTSIEE
ncbi:hypothetical protein [Streptomyces sp. NPDC001292]|uniref:hypothetical protein n=1 Tax=Streptomyces sp. NPDC001292 TaxID=3364558 RepID=UPI003683C99D